MKKLLILLLLFGCVQEPEIDSKTAIVNLSIEGLGLTSQSFARTIDEWVHVVSGADATISIYSVTDNNTTNFITPYNQLQLWITPLTYGDYDITIQQDSSPKEGLTFFSTSGHITVNGDNSINMSVNTNQSLIIINSESVKVGEIPKLLYNSVETDFILSNGFWYLYLQELIAPDEYEVSFINIENLLRSWRIIGALRETIYFINLPDPQGNTGFNLEIFDNVFNNHIFIE